MSLEVSIDSQIVHILNQTFPAGRLNGQVLWHPSAAGTTSNRCSVAWSPGALPRQTQETNVQLGVFDRKQHQQGWNSQTWLLICSDDPCKWNLNGFIAGRPRVKLSETTWMTHYSFHWRRTGDTLMQQHAPWSCTTDIPASKWSPSMQCMLSSSCPSRLGETFEKPQNLHRKFQFLVAKCFFFQKQLHLCTIVLKLGCDGYLI